MTTTDNTANALHERLAAIDVSTVPVSDLSRSTRRKELAASARGLFKSLRIVGISVTAPNYSMAQAVHVRLPKRDDHEPTDWNIHECDTCPACQANYKAHQTIAAILARAYPNHDDRSDSHSDYFNYKWSID